jgi:hypothetical protein
MRLADREKRFKVSMFQVSRGGIAVVSDFFLGLETLKL